MIEKVITIDNIPVPELLGSENKNLKEVASAFPKSKIISRGNEIKIIGSETEINRIEEVVESLILHFNKYGKVTPDNIEQYLEEGEKVINTNPEFDGNTDDIIVFGTRGVVVKPKTKNQKKLVEACYKNDMVFAIGPAGSGKTYISVALAVRALKNKEVKKIIITRPAVEAGENLGFLPGDLKEKVDPFLRPIYDALEDMIPSEKLKFYKENDVIEVAPLAYMRGRTLDNAFIILDEAQNTTPSQIKMFMTRLGPKGRMIITGDISQIDLPRNQKSGLVEALSVLDGVQGIGHVRLEGKDVVRHQLVKKIISAYDKLKNEK